jgi:glutamate-1-semialdehyde 2,1-aminomutase
MKTDVHQISKGVHLRDNFVERALRLFPGGSNGEYGFPPNLLPVLSHGAGCRVWDTAQKEYLDMTMAWGSALVGHAHPQVVEAASLQATRGANFASVNDRAVELAEQLATLCPCAERVRLVASGTEATLLCLRIARAATGRVKVMKFSGAYHGQHAVGVAGMLRGADTDGATADAQGSGAPDIGRRVLVAPYNDLKTTAALVEQHSHELAALIVEPLHRCLAPLPGFLEGLRDLTRRLGLPLIFDETVTGFRLALGGAQAYYGVVPDLAAYGKALGGGFPIGACVGRADLLDCLNEHRIDDEHYVWSASTGGGNPVSCAAALATLKILSSPEVYPRLHAMGGQLRQRLQTALNEAGEIVQVLGDGPLAQVAFSRVAVTDHRGWLASDRKRSGALMLALVEEGVFLNPMGTKLYLSLAHNSKALDEFIGRLRRAVASLPVAG